MHSSARRLRPSLCGRGSSGGPLLPGLIFESIGSLSGGGVRVAGCILATLVHAVVISDITAIVTRAVASVAAAACFAIGHVTGGIGMGDVKFTLVTGWMLGTINWSAVWWGHLGAFVLAGVIVTGGWLLGGWRREHPVPFGAFMGLGVIVAGAAALGSVG